ncbi:hypothetical protein SDC9_03514 [bioreactor metagenome]|uniref:Uncharacterized protein n=1 Tax=bioreactor metagenome TaxID=1076179 RepID=A0A644STI1_9ZZZZ|nr:hypothetical protein [Methanobrevibacter sp.]MEA4956133.1 hypothetical protein [Methanobrevibacter sp.]
MSNIYGRGYTDSGYVYLLPSGIKAYKFDFKLSNPNKWNAIMELTFKKVTSKVFVSGFIGATYGFFSSAKKNNDYITASGGTAIVLPTDAYGSIIKLPTSTPYAYSWKYSYTMSIQYII